MYKYRTQIYIGLILVFLLLMLFVVKSKEIKVDLIKYNEIEETVKDNQYSLIHVGELSEYTKKILVNMENNFQANIYNIEENEEIDENIEYLVYIKNKQVGTIAKETTESDIENKLKKYYLNIIPDNEIAYHNINSFSELNSITSKDKLSIIVFGALDCSYCTLYKPVMNEVATEEKLDFYYIEKDVLETDEYQSIRSLGFEVPKKCTTDNIDTDTTKSIATPLTLLIKKNKTVDCILGYVTKNELIELLKTNKLIK